MTLDLDSIRRQFPALETDWALFDNAGGTPPPLPVITRTHDYMRRCQVQLGASHALSRDATQRVADGHRAAAMLLGAEQDEIVLGASTTINVFVLAQAFGQTLRPGDEVVVTDLDHEANIGAWRRLERFGATIRTWRMRPETARLELDDLELLLNERTRLVCFTHCSNIVGAYHDVEAITRRVHAAGGLVCVDGVAFAPHRRVDVKALGVDFYLVSLYKTWGPHLAALYGRRELLLALPGQNHFFVDELQIPYKFQPGAVPHELAAAVPGILEYLGSLAAQLGADPHDIPNALDRCFGAFMHHEQELSRRLLDYLSTRRDTRLIGPPTHDASQRAPIVSFVVGARQSSEIVQALDEQHVAVRYGDFYARHAAEALSVVPNGGVVRVSMVHYNTRQEVDRLIAALDRV